jgi:hypothetical protein
MPAPEAKQEVARQLRWSWLDMLAWLSVAGAILSVLSIQAPWARIQLAITQPGQGASETTWVALAPRVAIDSLLSARFGVQSYRLAVDVTFLWFVTLASGVVLALALAFWRRSRLAGVAYLAWLALVTIGMALIAYSVFRFPATAACYSNCANIAVLARVPVAGLWLNAGALALIWVGSLARLMSLRRAGAGVGRAAFDSAFALRSLLSPGRIGAALATLGILVWFFGYVFTPWATQGCTGFPINWSHFVSGSCAGLDSDEVLVYATSSGFANGSYLGLWITGVLLAMLVALIAVWQPGWISLMFSLIWTISATWLTALAISGFPGVFKHSQHFNFSPAPWVVGYGPAVSVAGLVILWAGLAALGWTWLVGWRAIQSHSSGVNQRAMNEAGALRE